MDTTRPSRVIGGAHTHTHTPSGGEEGDRYDSVVSDSTRRTDERRSRLDLSNLWKSRRLRVRRNYLSFGGEREEEKKKKKDEGWTIKLDCSAWLRVRFVRFLFSLFATAEEKKAVTFNRFRNPLFHYTFRTRARRQEWRRSLEERDSPWEEDTVSFIHFNPFQNSFDFT